MTVIHPGFQVACLLIKVLGTKETNFEATKPGSGVALKLQTGGRADARRERTSCLSKRRVHGRSFICNRIGFDAVTEPGRFENAFNSGAFSKRYGFDRF